MVSWLSKPDFTKIFCVSLTILSTLFARSSKTFFFLGSRLSKYFLASAVNIPEPPSGIALGLVEPSFKNSGLILAICSLRSLAWRACRNVSNSMTLMLLLRIFCTIGNNSFCKKSLVRLAVRPWYSSSLR